MAEVVVAEAGELLLAAGARMLNSGVPKCLHFSIVAVCEVVPVKMTHAEKKGAKWFLTPP